jgi:hypothetical protein
MIWIVRRAELSDESVSARLQVSQRFLISSTLVHLPRCRCTASLTFFKPPQSRFRSSGCLRQHRNVNKNAKIIIFDESNTSVQGSICSRRGLWCWYRHPLACFATFVGTAKSSIQPSRQRFALFSTTHLNLNRTLLHDNKVLSDHQHLSNQFIQTR